MQIKTKNVQSIQILRLIAATSVVYFHIGTTPIFGSFGVDIFFVISGFVMAMVINNGQQPKSFAVSRLARIIPLYWLMTTIVYIISLIKPSLLGSTSSSLSNYLFSILFIPHFKEDGTLFPTLAVGWTLNYEMFFYLLIFLSLLISRARYFLIVTLSFVILFLTSNSCCGESGLFRAFYGNNIYFEFSYGLIAYKIFDKGYLKSLNRYFLIGLALILYALLAYFEVEKLSLPRFLLLGLPAFILVLAVTSLEGWIQSIKDSVSVKTLSAIGDASYATYLSHFFVVKGSQRLLWDKLHLFDPHSFLGTVLVIAISLIIGQGLYQLVDKPLSVYFRKLLNR